MDREHKTLGALVTAALLGLAALGGCDRAAEQGKTESPKGNAAAVGDAAERDSVGNDVVEDRNAAANDGKSVELKPIDKAGFDKLLAETDAQVVLVDYWGSWCVTCRQKFPHTVEFHEKYGDNGLQVVSLAVEFEPETGPAAALEFLKEQNAVFSNFVVADTEEDANKAFDVGGFPTYRLFRKGGELIANFESGEDHEEIEAAILKALEEQPAAGQQ